MKQFLTYVAVSAAFAASGNALAHGDEAKHGGIVQTAKDISFELVNKDGTAIIYVEDHGEKVPTAGASGKLLILKGGARSEAVLQPAGENTLKAPSGTALASGAKAIASINLPGQETVNVRFAIK